MGTLKNTSVFAFLLIFFFSAASAQSAYEKERYDGNALASYLGKNAESGELKSLEASYNCEIVNQSHCLSKSGIELILKDGHLNEINLYKTSNVYGDFKGKLPNGLIFGMSTAEVKKILGKPTIDYASGYSEYDLHTYTISCWFDGGILTQIGIIEKSSN